MKSKLYLISLLVLFLFSSCSSFKETHFFSDNTPGIPNYYRLKVSGFTLFSSSRFLSGYFDPEAVNDYFNEIKQPEKGKLNVDSFIPLADKFKDRRLVLILSSNSDAISNQIGLIADSKVTMDALGVLLFKDKFDEVSDLEVKNSVQTAKNQLLLDLGTTLIEGLDVESTNTPEMDSKAKVKASLLQYINALAAQLGNTTPFITFNEATEWLEKNRSGILNKQ